LRNIEAPGCAPKIQVILMGNRPSPVKRIVDNLIQHYPQYADSNSESSVLLTCQQQAASTDAKVQWVALRPSQGVNERSMLTNFEAVPTLVMQRLLAATTSFLSKTPGVTVDMYLTRVAPEPGHAATNTWGITLIPTYPRQLTPELSMRFDDIYRQPSEFFPLACVLHLSADRGVTISAAHKVPQRSCPQRMKVTALAAELREQLTSIFPLDRAFIEPRPGHGFYLVNRSYEILGQFRE
jgi:hypothetical protein